MSLLRDRMGLSRLRERVLLKPPCGHFRNLSQALLGATPAVNNLSPTSFGTKSRTSVPWTGLSLTVAVSWMLSLAFIPPAPVAPQPLEQEVTRVYETVKQGLFAGLLATAEQATSTSWNWRAEAFSDSPLSGQ